MSKKQPPEESWTQVLRALGCIVWGAAATAWTLFGFAMLPAFLLYVADGEASLADALFGAAIMAGYWTLLPLLFVVVGAFLTKSEVTPLLTRGGCAPYAVVAFGIVFVLTTAVALWA